METQKKTAKESQLENASKVAAIRAAIKEFGLADSDIKTSDFSVDAIKEDSGLPLVKITSFKTTHFLTLKVSNLEKGGLILDAVTNAGANRIEDITYTLKDETLKELQGQMLRLAAEDTRKRAENIAFGLNAKLGKPIAARDSFSSASTRTRERYRPSGNVLARMVSSAPSTEISGGELNLVATVTAKFLIK